MDNDCKEHSNSNNSDAQKFDWYPIGKYGALLIMAYYLWTEHQAHVITFLPYLLLLACPLMHIFMHGGHGGHNHQNDQKNKETKQ
jgi:hypothetical protein